MRRAVLVLLLGLVAGLVAAPGAHAGVEVALPAGSRARPVHRAGGHRPRAAVRLGVAAALVDGALVPGDVEVDGDCIAGVGLGGAGRGTPRPAASTSSSTVRRRRPQPRRPRGSRARGRGAARDRRHAYLPTFVTAPEPDILARCARCRTGRRSSATYLEGPFLAPGRLGAHPPEWRRDPDPALLDRLLASGRVTHVTLAPELPGALDLVDC